MLYVLSLGTNIGNRKANLQKAEESLNLVLNTKVLSKSLIYETKPIGYDEQDNFYNVIFLVKSEFEPNEMLGICMGIEAGLGRKRNFKNGPRIIDIDLIFAENRKIETENLIVPHPRTEERRFVLEPMLDIFTDGNAFGFDIKTPLSKIKGQEIKKIQQQTKN